jgi:hypothetical protein
LMRRQTNPFASGGALDSVHEEKSTPLTRLAPSGLEVGATTEHNGSWQSRLAADGGVVRTMPTKTPQRLARWMPRRIRAAVLAQQAAAADGTEEEGERLKDEETKRPETPKRPRQLAVPYQNYRRYRG